MVAKISKGSGFKGCLKYNLDEKKGYLLETNMNISNGISPTGLSREFRSFSSLNERCKKPVLHIPVSFSKKDNLSDEEMKDIAKKFLERFEIKMNGGFKPEGSRPYVIIRHTDTEHQHFHIITSQVDSTGKVLKDNNDYKVANKLCRELEKEFGLERVSSVKKDMKSISIKEINMEKRRKEENNSFLTPRKELVVKINESIKGIGGGKQTFSGFVNELKKRGVDIYLNTSMDHSRINGISYSLKHDNQNRVFKGSALGKGFTWEKIKNSVYFNPEKEQGLVVLLANKERFKQPELTINDMKSIKKTFKINLETYQMAYKKLPVFNLNYRLEKIDFSQKQAIYLKQLNADWSAGNYKNDPIKYFENTYKIDRLKKYYDSITYMKSLSNEEKNKEHLISLDMKNELNKHLKTFMEKEGYEYSKSINDKIEPLILTRSDNQELLHLNKSWQKNDFEITPMSYLYERIQIHQTDYKNNLEKSLKSLDERYQTNGNFSSKEMLDGLLKLADKTNFNRQVPFALLKLDKEVLSGLKSEDLKQLTSERIVNFVMNEITPNVKTREITTGKEMEESSSNVKPSGVGDLFKGIGSGPGGGNNMTDENSNRRKRYRKPKKE